MRASHPSGRARWVSLTPTDHEPDTGQQPLFPSAAVATEIIALLDER
jgi:hypothetical protein